jgi:hypothetical protein
MYISCITLKHSDPRARDSHFFVELVLESSGLFEECTVQSNNTSIDLHADYNDFYVVPAVQMFNICMSF